MYIITGACGFIGSYMCEYLNSLGIDDSILVDDISLNDRNLKGLKYHSFYDINDISLFDNKITGILHFGAISNTLEKNIYNIKKYNVENTLWLYNKSKERRIPMIFASTAAVYGNGNGPLNLYAESKLQCEKMISDYAKCFRLFNVYGPGESHKEKMSSVVFKWFNQLKDSNTITLFENSQNFKRDFIYVEDVCKTWYDSMLNFNSGICDLGTGTQTSFEQIADMMIEYNRSGNKTYVPIPEELKRQYQTNTIAKINEKMIDIKDGISKYMDYLNENTKTSYSN